VVDHVLHLSFPGLDSEGLMVATKDLIAVSNGSDGGLVAVQGAWIGAQGLEALGAPGVAQGKVRWWPKDARLKRYSRGLLSALAAAKVWVQSLGVGR